MQKWIFLSGLILFLSFPALSAQADNENVTFGVTPNWVEVKSVTLPETLPHDTIEGGIYYVLVDQQTQVTENAPPQYYRKYADLIVNQQGLETAPQISILFDPIYESVVFHTLNVIRNDDIIDKIKTSTLSILQRESDLDDLVIDGRLTANFILDDIRIGDIIEYSYSIIGDNPVYQGIFSQRKSIQWSVPVHQQSIRLLWGKTRPVFVSHLHTSHQISKQKKADFTEYSLEIMDEPPLVLNTETPAWFRPYAKIIFSETEQWSDVIAWILPLYQQAIAVTPEVKNIAQNIRKKYNDPQQQIAETLRFVQSEIRYFGIELGINSHQPSSSSETLQRRYGDCKDKAVLYISILKELGIKSSPALVNTRFTRLLGEYPATVDAFNHVIVKVESDGRIFWLDPTRQYQYGKLIDIHQPDYTFALVIDPATTSLETMQVNPERAQINVEDYFDLTQGVEKPVGYKIKTEYIGLEAEKKSADIAEYGLASIQKDYLEFYQNNYGETAINNKMLISTDEPNSKTSILEDYQLNQFWKKNNDKEKYYANFYANSISDNLPIPDEKIRNSPFRITFPTNIKQTIKASFPDTNWYFEDEDIIEDNRFFYFRYIAGYDEAAKILTLSYQLNLRTDHIPSDDIQKYIQARKKVVDLTTYGIQKPFPHNNTSGSEPDEEWDLYTWIVISYFILALLGLAFSIINWRLESRKNQLAGDTVFFPVSLVKLLVLNIATLGIYAVYWFYRNWKYIKDKEKSSLMPVARGIFNQFWYYHLSLKLMEDSQTRYQQNRLPVKPVTLLIAIGYLLLSFLYRIDYLFIPILIAQALILFPLANYINHIEQINQPAFHINSRWQLRHSILCIIFTPILLLDYASAIHLLPGNTVIAGHQVWSHDIMFMHRKKAFPASDKLLYFYSDAFFNMHNDGNGFTNNHVFSYWKEGNDFFLESASFGEIKDIKAAYSNSISENTTVTITRIDDSTFILYISNTDKGDKKFIQALKEQWQLAK